MRSLGKLEGIIFDLDGTLYADTDHFSYFSKLLAQKLPASVRGEYFQQEQAIWHGNHCLRIGRTYDRKNDYVLEATPEGVVLAAWTWQGARLPDTSVAKLYTQPITFDMNSMISIGDGWWIPTACAYHFGVDSTYDAYLETKDYLASEEARVSPIPGVKEALTNLSNRMKLIVATNSDEKDTRRILKRLGLSQIFDSLYCECQKPQFAKRTLHQIVSDNQIPYNYWLSVGDNYLNDIYPAYQLGMRTCLIDPLALYKGDEVDVVLSSLDQLFR